MGKEIAFGELKKFLNLSAKVPMGFNPLFVKANMHSSTHTHTHTHNFTYELDDNVSFFNIKSHL